MPYLIFIYYLKTMKLHEMIREFYPEYYSIERYPAVETICIRGTKDEWG